jgi:hypothetical protein
VPSELNARPGSGGRIRWKRLPVNMTGVERVVRLLAGILLAGGGTWVLAGHADGAVAVAAWALLVIGVTDLVVSGLVGHCPVYRYVRTSGTRGTTS